MLKRSGIKILKPYKGLIHLVYPNQYTLTSSFIRFQEYYESPSDSIKGKIFSLDDVMDDYADRFQDMTYFADWDGFNMPGYIFESGLLMLSPLREKERLLADIVYQARETQKFYLIGTHPNNDCSEHEIAHSLFYLDNDYRIQVEMILNQLDHRQKKPIMDELLGKGYCFEVLTDEMNSYLIDAVGGYSEWAKFLEDPKVKLTAENLNLLFKDRFQRATNEQSSALQKG